jgi:phosphinothricin acetyltransferase
MPVSHPSKIRPISEKDGEACREIYAASVLREVASFELEAPSRQDFAARVEKITAHYPWLVYEEGGKVLGYAYVDRFNPRGAYAWSVLCSVYVAPEAQGRGIGRALYGELFPLTTSLGYCSVFAGITLPNLASIRLHESFGFRKAAVYEKVGFKMGQWHDVGWWQLDLREKTTPPPLIHAWTGEERAAHP